MKGDAPLLPSRIPLRAGLLACQVAISVFLVADASLITRAFGLVATQNPGFDTSDVSVVTFELPGSYQTPRRRAFSRQLLQRGETALAPRPAAFTDTAPFARGGREWTVAELPGGKAGLDKDVLVREVSPGFFDVIQVPIVEGRTLASTDVADRGVLVNEAMAKRFWPGESALGRIFVSGGDRHVVGVVRDTRAYAATSWSPSRPCTNRSPDERFPSCSFRHLDPAGLDALRSLALALEPDVQIHAAPLDRNLDALLREPRLITAIANAIGLLALALASFGVFSVVRLHRRAAEGGNRHPHGARRAAGASRSSRPAASAVRSPQVLPPASPGRRPRRGSSARFSMA